MGTSIKQLQTQVSKVEEKVRHLEGVLQNTPQYKAVQEAREELSVITQRLDKTVFQSQKLELMELGFHVREGHQLLAFIEGDSIVPGIDSSMYTHLIVHRSRPLITWVQPGTTDLGWESGSVKWLQVQWQGDDLPTRYTGDLHYYVLGYGTTEQEAWKSAITEWFDVFSERDRDVVLKARKE